MTPEQTSALMREAIQLQQLGRHEQALALYARIAEHYPHHPDVLHNSGLARSALGELGAAETLLLRALRLRPRFDRARANLVKLWTRMDRVQTLHEIVADPAWIAALDFDACMALSGYLQQRKEYDRSVAALRRAIELDPASAPAQHLLGLALCRMNDAEQGEGHLRAALRLQTDSPPILVDLARCLFSIHMRSKRDSVWREGRALVARALELAPQNARIQHEMGRVLEEEGDFTGAGAAFERALASVPDYLPALSSLAALGRTSASVELLTALECALAREQELPVSEISRGFQALGKCLDGQGDFDRAFECFDRAKAVLAAGRPYERSHRERYVDGLIEIYSAKTIAACRLDAVQPGRPIFIVGMPRSGTTLLEHMLAGHPQVKGAGELPFFTALESTGGALHGPDGRRSERWSERVQPPYRQALRSQFDSILHAVDPDARYVIDKMPFNFSQLGMIATVYPEAKIIHCTRDRMDVGLSCFIESFHEAHTWSLSLPGIGHFQRQYQRLMAHWAGVLGERIHEVRYESLVADREAILAGVLRFLGLDWREEMASYVGNPRPIRTPSNWQVRRPVYATSIDRWQRYEQHLQPLIRELDGLPPGETPAA